MAEGDIQMCLLTIELLSHIEECLADAVSAVLAAVLPGLSARGFGCAGEAGDKEVSNRGYRVLVAKLYKSTTHTNGPCMNVAHTGPGSRCEFRGLVYRLLI